MRQINSFCEMLLALEGLFHIPPAVFIIDKGKTQGIS